MVACLVYCKALILEFYLPRYVLMLLYCNRQRVNYSLATLTLGGIAKVYEYCVLSIIIHST